jgi:hypothetical protein
MLSLLKTNIFYLLTITSVAVCMPAVVQSQTVPEPCQKAIERVTNAHTPAERDKAIRALLLPGRNQKCYAMVIAGKPTSLAFFESVLKTLEATRTDKQAGSSTGSGGSTNLVSKGVTAQVLSFAAEHGALTESVNKNVVTVQGSLDGIPAVFIQQNLIPYCPESEPKTSGCFHQGVIETLRRFSYGVSFDTGQSQQNITATAAGSQQASAQPVTFTANQQQITQVVGKVMLFHSKESITSKSFKDEWDKTVKNLDDAKVGQAFASLWGNLITPGNNAAFKAWLDCAHRDLSNASDAELDVRWTSYAQMLPKIFSGNSIVSPQPECSEISTQDQRVNTDPALSDIVAHSITNADITTAAVNALRALTAFEFNEQQFVAGIIEKPVLTFEYDYNRPVGQPDNSTFKLIYGQGFGQNWSVTANESFNIFNSQPTLSGAGRLAYNQFAFELDRNFTLFGPTTASAAYYFQYQNSPGIVNVTPGNPAPGVTFVNLSPTATQAFAQKGNIHVGQLKLTVGAGASSVKFPLSVTFANRTDLITSPKPLWRGQVGVSYDLDALFAGK